MSEVLAVPVPGVCSFCAGKGFVEVDPSKGVVIWRNYRGDAFWCLESECGSVKSACPKCIRNGFCPACGLNRWDDDNDDIYPTCPFCGHVRTELE